MSRLDKGVTNLVALPPYPRGRDEGETQNALLLRIVHVVQYDRITGEDRFDHSLVESHDEVRDDAAAGAMGQPSHFASYSSWIKLA